MSVALAYALTHHEVRRVVQGNLQMLRKEKVDAMSAVKVFWNYGAAISDYVVVGNMPLDEGEALCTERIGWEHLREAREGGKGAILATGHLGLFEYGALLLAKLGFPVTVMTLPEPSRELTQWRANFRRRWGAETIEIGDDVFGSLEVIRCLEQGRFVAMLVDRPPGGRGTVVELPNGRMRFSTAAALVSYVSGRPILPVAVSRRPDGSFRMVAEACIWPERGKMSKTEAIEAMTQQLAQALLPHICENAEQWYQFVPLAV